MKFLFLALSLLLCTTTAGAAGLPTASTYSLRAAGMGTGESVLVQVVCPVASPAVAAEVASQCAVHGVIFTGSIASERVPAQQPLVRSEQLSAEQTAWLEAFFREGKYKNYVVSVARGSMKITRVKKTYTAEVIVAVDKRKLRRELEEAGIVRELAASIEKP